MMGRDKPQMSLRRRISAAAFDPTEWEQKLVRGLSPKLNDDTVVVEMSEKTRPSPFLASTAIWSDEGT